MGVITTTSILTFIFVNKIIDKKSCLKIDLNEELSHNSITIIIINPLTLAALYIPILSVMQN